MKNNFFSFLLLILSIVIFIFALLKSFIYISEGNSNKEIMQEINNNIQTTESNVITNDFNYIINFNELKEKNTDAIGLIDLPGTNIRYAVVQSKDNDFYLYRNFNKEKNSSGWIFADYRNKLDGTDKNVIIYGHNMRNGTMFSNLKNYLKPSWYGEKTHNIIYFVTPNNYCKYEIFSVYEIKNENYYLKTKFKSDEFINYINTVKSRSVISFDVKIDNNDSILTLSTCGSTNDYRIVLHAKKVNSP